MKIYETEKRHFRIKKNVSVDNSLKFILQWKHKWFPLWWIEEDRCYGIQNSFNSEEEALNAINRIIKHEKHKKIVLSEIL